MEIRNKTKRPLRVLLPAGKKLHLGPGGTGQVVPKALEHPPLKKLIEAGEIEVLDVGTTQGKAAGTRSSGSDPSQAGGGAGGVRHTGDR